MPETYLSLIVSKDQPANPNAIWLKPVSGDASLVIGTTGRATGERSNMLFVDDMGGSLSGVDRTTVQVIAATAGNRAIGVATLDGIHPGEWYTISDGVHSELVQAKSSGKNDGILRFTTKTDIVNTYDLANTKVYRTSADMTAKDESGRGVVWQSGTEIVLAAHEFIGDGINALAMAGVAIRHDTLTKGELKAWVKFQGEVKNRDNAVIGVGSGRRVTYTLPDRGPGIDYNTIRVFIDGVETTDFSANTETDLGEITLTARTGATVAASYAYDYQDEVWQPMTLTAVENYGTTGEMASVYEYFPPDRFTAKTRTAIKIAYESDEAASANVYAVSTFWAKAKKDADA